MFGGKRSCTEFFRRYRLSKRSHKTHTHEYHLIKSTDLVGFTSWSSVREPSQVFTLLETVYNSFDAIAKRRQVFKVETVGDCYVAVGAYIPSARYLIHI